MEISYFFSRRKTEGIFPQSFFSKKCRFKSQKFFHNTIICRFYTIFMENENVYWVIASAKYDK